VYVFLWSRHNSSGSSGITEPEPEMSGTRIFGYCKTRCNFGYRLSKPEILKTQITRPANAHRVWGRRRPDVWGQQLGMGRGWAEKSACTAWASWECGCDAARGPNGGDAMRRAGKNMRARWAQGRTTNRGERGLRVSCVSFFLFSFLYTYMDMCVCIY
jgi:hypothetical protein